MSPTALVQTFYGITAVNLVTIAEFFRVRSINCKLVSDLAGRLLPLAHDALKRTCSLTTKSFLRGRPPEPAEGDFVLPTKDAFNREEMLCISGRDPHCVIKPLNNLVYCIGNLCTALCMMLAFHGLSFIMM